MQRTAVVVLFTMLAIMFGYLSMTGAASSVAEAPAPVEALECAVDGFAGEDTLMRGKGPKPKPTPPQTCGQNVCGVGEYCCNASCGTCVPFGWACTQEVCDPVLLD